MNGKLKQFEVQYYIHWLSHNDNFGMYANRYDDKTYLLLDELFELVSQVAPMYKNGARSLWFTADRGTLEDFNVDERIENGEFDSKEEAIDFWKSMYPDEVEWYEFGAFEDKKEKYRAVSLAHNCIIVDDEKREKSGFEQEISEFVQWLIDSLKGCIQMLREGTYNSFVENNLPPQHKTGTILRKDFWDVWPHHREEFFEGISADDVAEFIELAYNQAKDYDSFNKRLSHMTANDFFRYCAMGYEACHYECADKSPKELYICYADGRDEGLTEIDGDSEEAFMDWLNDREHCGGHPWEVCRGGNSTHIDLSVHYDEKGFFLFLAGKSWIRTVEAAHFYLALNRVDIPVFLFESEALADRMAEKEFIGIVPDGITPRYCESRFPGEHIITFMNLTNEDRELFLPFCHWQPIKPVTLINQQKEDVDPNE